MIDHFTFGVKNYTQSFNFYKSTLGILYPKDLLIKEQQYPSVIKEIDYEDPQSKYVAKANAVLYNGVKFASFVHTGLNCGISIIDLTYGVVEPLSPNYYGSPKGAHLAFKAKSKEDIDKWYSKAIELGATCNGRPGPRPMYGPHYYGAFVIDHNGNRIEATLNSAFSKL